MSENNGGGDLEQSVPSAQPESTGETVTVVLTADNHLGYTAFGQSPRKREERQQRMRRAFQQATEFAVGQGVDLFVQAGDLFDTPTPAERDRSFVSARLAQLRHADIRVFALGGTHDTPTETQNLLGEGAQAPQLSYANLGVLHYFAPHVAELEPVMFTVRNTRVGICGLGVLADEEGDPLARAHVSGAIERAAVPILVLHAPIEGLSSGTSLLDNRAQVSRASIEQQSMFRYILAGYNHSFQHVRIGQTEVIVAGATQHIDFSTFDSLHADDDQDDRATDGAEKSQDALAPEPGFVFLGLAADGIRWCKHMPVDALKLQRLAIQTHQLWNTESTTAPDSVTASIIERLQPLCNQETMIQLRLAGPLTRGQYHQLDLNQIRRYGEEHCFALAIDDSCLDILPEQEAVSVETGERFSPREELVALADEWIAAVRDEQEQKALLATKEDVLAAMDEVKRR